MITPANSKTPLVSVVVPIFNVADYLVKCIQSLLDQAYTNLEIILIDDGSTDNSPEICRRFAERDSRIRVIHKRNGGLSDARNTGIEMARGEYIAFLDGDDYVHQDFIKILIEQAIRNDVDISACSFYKVYDDGTLIEDSIRTSQTIFTSTEAIREIILLSNHAHVWTKIYKKSLFTDNKIRFPVGSLHEDTLTTYKLLAHANRVAYIDMPLYYYLQRSTGIMGQRFSRKNLSMVDACDEILVWIRQNKLPLEDEAMAYRLSLTLYMISWIARGPMDNGAWNLLTDWIAQNRNGLLFGNRFVGNSQRAIVLILLSGKRPYRSLRWIALKMARS